MLRRLDPHDFRQELEARILALADLDRVPLIEELIALDARARGRAKAGRRAARNSVVRIRADEAMVESHRLGRIIYFLRFRSPASSATADDLVLCSTLAEKLTAKGQWSGEYLL